MKNKQEIEKRLEEIATRNNGRLTPDDVVTDARDENSPLHHLFEWDIDKAAALHWIDTARKIISSVDIVIKHQHIEVKTPLYVRDPEAGAKEQGYVKVTDLKDSKAAARDALISEFQRVGDLLRRAKHIGMVLGLGADIDNLLSSIISIREKLKA